MKRLAALAVIAWVIGAFSISAAQNVTIDFDSLEINGTGLTQVKTHSEDGFLISDTVGSAAAFVSAQQGNLHYFGSANLLYNYVGSNDWAIVSSASAAPFTLNSIDLHGWNAGAQTVDFYAYDSGQTQVGHAFLSFDDAAAWHTLTFGTDFQNITSVRWQQKYPYHVFDKISINSPSVIPEPVSFLLYVLGGLVLLAKNKNKGRPSSL